MEKYYKTLLFSLPEIVYQVDTAGNFIYLNDSIRQLGYAPSDLLGKHFSTIIAPHDRQLVDRDFFLSNKDLNVPTTSAPQFFNERRTGKRITCRLKLRLLCRNKNSETGYSEFNGEVFATGLYETRKHGGSFVGTIGIIREISGDVEHENTILRIERFYRMLIENSLDVITILAHDGTVLYISSSIERISGHPPIHYIGENTADLLHPEDWSIVEPTLREDAMTADARRIEFRLQTSGSEWRFFESTLISITGDEGRQIMPHTSFYRYHQAQTGRRVSYEEGAPLPSAAAHLS